MTTEQKLMLAIRQLVKAGYAIEFSDCVGSFLTYQVSNEITGEVIHHWHSSKVKEMLENITQFIKSNGTLIDTTQVLGSDKY